MRYLLAAITGIALALPAHAQSLRAAVEAAWMRQPLAQARLARAEEFAARRDAAQVLFPEPPSLVIGSSDERLDRDRGAREMRAGIAFPLWLPGEQARQTAIVGAERNQYAATLTAAKLRVAGEVRDAYWQVRLAESELALARRKVEEAVVLAADVERRVKAGDLARVDLNQAQAAERLARAALAEAGIKTFRARQGFNVLTGLTVLGGVNK